MIRHASRYIFQCTPRYFLSAGRKWSTPFGPVRNKKDLHGTGTFASTITKKDNPTNFASISAPDKRAARDYDFTCVFTTHHSYAIAFVFFARAPQVVCLRAAHTISRYRLFRTCGLSIGVVATPVPSRVRFSRRLFASCVVNFFLMPSVLSSFETHPSFSPVTINVFLVYRYNARFVSLRLRT